MKLNEGDVVQIIDAKSMHDFFGGSVTLISFVFLCFRFRVSRGIVLAKQRKQFGLPQYDRAKH